MDTERIPFILATRSASLMASSIGPPTGTSPTPKSRSGAAEQNSLAQSLYTLPPYWFVTGKRSAISHQPSALKSGVGGHRDRRSVFHFGYQLYLSSPAPNPQPPAPTLLYLAGN